MSFLQGKKKKKREKEIKKKAHIPHLFVKFTHSTLALSQLALGSSLRSQFLHRT